MHVLIIEDNRDLASNMFDFMEAKGHVVDAAGDGITGLHLAVVNEYDAIVLDLGLPVVDGVTVLRRWRDAARDTPVLILTARDQWSEKVAGFDAGADDYVTKPFHMEEVIARLRALIRRAAGQASPEMVCGPLRVDTRSGRAAVDGNPVKLTANEFKVLTYLMHHQGKVVSRTELTEHIYQQDFDRDSNTIEVFVGRLRKKLDLDLIQTVRGLGYRLEPPAEADG